MQNNIQVNFVFLQYGSSYPTRNTDHSSPQKRSDEMAVRHIS